MRGRNGEKVEGGVVGDKVKLMEAAPVGSLEFRVTRAPTVTWMVHWNCIDYVLHLHIWTLLYLGSQSQSPIPLPIQSDQRLHLNQTLNIIKHYTGTWNMTTVYQLASGAVCAWDMDACGSSSCSLDDGVSLTMGSESTWLVATAL